MPDAIQWALQKALYDKLTSAANLTALLPNGTDDIYSHVPDDTPPLYCLFRLAGAEKIATKLHDALEISVLIECYNAKKTAQNGHDIAAEIKNTLDKAEFILADYNVIDCRFEKETIQAFEGGRLQKTSQIFKIIIEPK